MKLKLYCTCGAYSRGTMSSTLANALMASWDRTHQGDGHAPCGEATARRARVRAEKKNLAAAMEIC